MATISNKSLNTGNLTNKSRGSASITFSDIDATLSETPGTFANPYNLFNKSVTTGSMTNKPLS
jgi:hypothetical protein